MRIILPASAKNWLSLAGVIIVLTSLFMILFFFIVTSIFRAQAVYLGLVTYILLPAVMFVGLMLIPLGMFLKVRRESLKGIRTSAGWPKIDLEEPHHRNTFFIFVIGAGIFVMLSAVGSYEAFQYTESVSFCGTLCHRVMKPEYTAYGNSPHARVACVDCHVGPGADWYVRSKLSGLYQVYATIANVYPRPIPTPIKDLRPARAVCEQCHWPQKFYGYKLVVQTHYLPEQGNTPWKIGLNLKVGPSQAALGLIEGIHWHINPHVRINYIAADQGRQDIPWVRYTNLETGEVKEFRDRGWTEASGKLVKMETRTMDCMDCHNRPSHLYRTPAQFINEAITAGRVPASLPEIKKVAVQFCAAKYPSDAAAQQGIRGGITAFYRDTYPDLFATRRGLVQKGTEGVLNGFEKNIFPRMKASWQVYQDNIGHLYYRGCFRCHDGSHVSDGGETIGGKCTLCHDIAAQGTPGKGLETTRIDESLGFRHPVDIGGAWQETPCTDCHSGANP